LVIKIKNRKLRKNPRKEKKTENVQGKRIIIVEKFKVEKFKS